MDWTFGLSAGGEWAAGESEVAFFSDRQLACGDLHHFISDGCTNIPNPFGNAVWNEMGGAWFKQGTKHRTDFRHLPLEGR